MNLPAIRRTYARLNLAERLNDRLTERCTWLTRSSLMTQRALAGHQQLQRPARQLSLPQRGRCLLKTAGYEAAARYALCLAGSLTLERGPLLPFRLLRGRASFAMAELLLGRGQSNSRSQLLPGMTLGVSTEVFDQLSQEGLFGWALCVCPLQQAAGAEARGAPRLARAWALGALAGRAALQPLRLAVCAWALLSQAIDAARLFAFFTAAELSVRGTRTVLEEMWPTLAARPAVAAGFDTALAFLDLSSISGTVVPDVLDAHVPLQDGTPDIHSRVTAEVARALQRFGGKNFDMDDPAQRGEVRQLANQIVGDLRQRTAGLSDAQVLRGGIAHLQAFMDITYEEAQWLPPAAPSRP